MPEIPILLSDSSAVVQYKIRLVGEIDQREIEIADLNTWREYYAGKHDLLLSADQKAFLKGVISDENDWPIDNKCKTVVDKIRARLNVVGWKNDAGDKRLLDEMEGDQAVEDTAPTSIEQVVGFWLDNEMDQWEGDVYLQALRDAESYIIVDYGGQRPRLMVTPRYDGSYGIRMIYSDPQTHMRPVAAIKYWYTVDPTNVTLNGIERATLYTSNAVRKYARFVAPGQMEQFIRRGDMGENGYTPISDSADEPWPIPWTDRAGAPLGLAVIPFRSPRGSVIDGIIGLNNALNKTNLDLLADADQQGFGIIVAKYDTMPTPDPTKKPDDDGMGFRPARIIETDADVTKLPADDMAGLLALSRHWKTSIASNSDIPLYEFEPISGEVPSGAALEMLDGALADQADEAATWFSASWRAVMLLAQKLEALWGNSGLQPQRISPVWASTKRQSATGEEARKDAEAARLKALTDAGLPLAIALEHEGWTPEQIAEVVKAKSAEKAADQASLATVLVEAQRKADAGQNNVYPTGTPVAAPNAQPGA